MIAKYAGIPLTWDSATANAWPSTKEKAVFGQLPYIEDNGHVYAQSGAIYRILARRGGLEGASDHDFAVNQMLIEEYQDVYFQLAKPMYIKDDAARAAAWEESLTKYLPSHLSHIEKLIGQNGIFSSDRISVGDILMVCLFQIVSEIDATSLEKFPKLSAFFAKHRDAVISADLLKTPPYIVRK